MSHDNPLVSKTVRLPADLVDAATAWGADRGLSFTDVVEVGLRELVDLPADQSIYAVLEGVRTFLLERWPERDGFPTDVTLQVVHHIRDDATLRRHYELALEHHAGADARERRRQVHARIGKAVRLVLRAEVVGRSGPLDPDEHLIKSHALLSPTTA